MKTQITILAIALYFIFNGCIPRENQVVNYGCLTFNNWEDYKEQLLNDGYNDASAELIAKVEFNLMEENNEYNALIND